MRWNASFNNKNVDFEQLPEQKSDGSGGVYVITKSKSSETKVKDKPNVLNKTYNEIMAAIAAGQICIIKGKGEIDTVDTVEYVVGLASQANSFNVVSSGIGSSGIRAFTYLSDSGDGVLTRTKSA